MGVAARLIEDEPWWLDASCADADTALFFPDTPSHLPEAVAAICEMCPVRGECLEHALHFETYGIWAGTTEVQRRRTRRALGIRVYEPPPRLVGGSSESDDGGRDDGA